MTLSATQLYEQPIYDTSVFKSTTAGILAKMPLIIQQGGTYSGKTYNVILALITYLKQTNERLTVSIVSCTFPHLKRGAVRDFQDIASKVGGVTSWNKSDYIATVGDSIIEFFSADNDGKVRGGKRDILFINEANLINYERYRQLSMRTRRTTIIDYNPVSEFWLHSQVFPGIKNNEYLFKLSTYKDNPTTPEKVIKDVESLKLTNPTLYNVYALGKTGTVEGLIFKDITLVDELPEYLKKKAYGMDFGFTNDPTTIIQIGFSGDNLYLHEILYETNLTNQDVGNRLAELGFSKRLDEICADSAEPKSIEELRRMGWNIWPCEKREIIFGIDLMLRYKIHITKSSLNLLKEFRNYSWRKTPDGKSVNVPIDSFNHGIDAARYAVLFKMRSGLPKLL